MTVITNFPEPDEGSYSLEFSLSPQDMQLLCDESDRTGKTQNEIMEKALRLYLTRVSRQADSSLLAFRKILEDIYES